MLGMLGELGLDSIDELFEEIPEKLRSELNLPAGLSEQEVYERLKKLSSKNSRLKASFIGAGLQTHYIPSAVSSITSRSEFYTSYTPYQPEISQGLLQALFEYQSLMAELTEMDVVNSSMYDQSTALGEAARMCFRINGKKTFLIPRAISSYKKSVLKNYCEPLSIKILEMDYNEKGTIDIEKIQNDGEVCGIYIESPNFFGIIEDEVEEIREMTDTLMVYGFSPLSLGVLKTPGAYNADISIGEGGDLLANNFGGPLLGIFCCKKEFIRKMPGRLIGGTQDKDSRRAFCMTLQTREQHIRRSRATSNICTNESLCAVALAVELALIGGKGLRDLAIFNMNKTEELMRKIDSIEGFKVPYFRSYHFNEFLASSKIPPEKINEELLKNNIQGGYIIGGDGDEDEGKILYCVTELNQGYIDELIEVLKKCSEKT